MEFKTKIFAEDGKQELKIEREFELPVDSVFRAHTEKSLIEQWMGTNVIHFDAKNHGGWAYETKNLEGEVVFRANGVFHNIIQNESFVRTFEMENAGFAVQLEFFSFEAISETHSKLSMHIIYRSVEQRDAILKMPFAMGISYAHDRLETIFKT